MLFFVVVLVVLVVVVTATADIVAAVDFIVFLVGP